MYSNNQMDSKPYQSFIWASTIIMYLVLGFPCLAIAMNHGNETDREALLEFKAKIIDDPIKVLSSWNESIHFCKWYGVQCGHRNQRVVSLNLSSRHLTGTISPYIGNLSFLRALGLQNNSFFRELPPQLGHLRRLQYLYLNNNSIGGKIPSNISGCFNLNSLSVSYNTLEGEIPEVLGSLSKLQYIDISDNNLTGAIPSSLGNLSSLVLFYALSNRLVGSIPNEIKECSMLQIFSAEENRLSGTIPHAIFNISSINTFSVLDNQLHGTLPQDLGITLPKLNDFGISINQFSGTIPVSMSNLSNLEFLYLGDNNLSGKVPNFEKLNRLRELVFSLNSLGNGEENDLSFISSLTNASNLQVFGLNGNNFGGSLPKSFGNLSKEIKLLHFENNQISGSFPGEITSFVNLEDLHMGNNQLTGNIPPDIDKLQKLRQLNISQNKLSGNIPSSLGNLSLLTILGLEENDFRGIIPISLGNCQNLQSLSLAGNQLSNTIPLQIFSLSSLSLSLDLSRNQLNGSLPLQVGNLKSIQELDVSQNVLSGVIPSTLGACVGLEKLYVQGNLFYGSIPSSFESLRGLQFLDMSCNNMSGNIPEYFGDFNFLYLNLSFNDFGGALPNVRIFTNANVTSFTGNPRLCGAVPEMHLPRCNFKQSKKFSSTLTFRLLVSLIPGLLGLSLFLVFLYIGRLRKAKKEHQPDSLGNLISRMSYHTLLRATDNFSSSNLVGIGGFGSVYKGILDNDGRIVAVKVFNLLHHGAAKSFVAECEALRNIRHRNLVKVLSVCSSVDYQGNDFKALVYEFMENGSLDEWLHPNQVADSANVELKKLTILQRINIAIDVAHALDYLHNNSGTPIVHCDLKPSNVLLDNELVGHVGDFGLARLVLTTNQSFSAEQSTSACVKGSIGYTAPEYGMGGKASTYGDVYSFGILLMEMFTAKRPTDDMFKDGLSICNFVEAALPEEVADVADPVLFQKSEQEEVSTCEIQGHSSNNTKKIRECLISIFRVGVACCAEFARERMKITEAAAELSAIREEIMGTRCMNRHTG